MRNAKGFTLVEVLFVLAMAGILILAIPWTFTGFACLWFLVAGFVWVAAVAAANKGRIAFGIAMIPVIGCLVSICLMLPTVYPMQFARLHGATYESEPLVSVLSDIAGQKDGYPSWRFLISDHNLARQQVSVEIPDGCRLGHALELVSGAAGCEYTWHWHKTCGNAPSPSYAAFCFVAVGGDHENVGFGWDAEVIVRSDRIYYRPEQ